MAELSQAKRTFINRMAAYVLRGLSFKDAARAVLADDQRIMVTMDQNKILRNKIAYRIASSVWHTVCAADRRKLR